MKQNYSLKKSGLLLAIILLGGISIKAATITVSSAAEAAGANYNTIQAAYNYIKGLGTISQAYTIEIQSTYAGEATYPISFTAIAGASITNTITIKPATGATVVIANPVVTATVNKTVVFDGASYVTIDGVARTGATTLTIQNPNTESAHTVFFTNDAINNTIKNCFIKGASVTKGSATINNAVIYFDAQANNGNTIESNDICDIDGVAKPVTMILLNNTSGPATDYNTISNNKIYNFNYVATTANGTAAAIHVAGASANVRIYDNKIFWTGTIADTKAALSGITFDATSIGTESRVEGNVIGGSAIDNSGTATFNTTGEIRGINVNLNSIVKNNVVKNITLSTSSPNNYMIAVNPNGTALTDVDAWSGNTIANVDMLYSTGNTTTNLYCIYLNPSATTPARNISNNTIYGCSILSTPVITTVLRGIYVHTTVPTALWNYSGNKLYDLTCKETTETSTNGIVGIDTRANSGLIERNMLYNFKNLNTVSKESILHGIRMNGNNASGTTIKNNVISLGYGVTGSSQIRAIVHTGAGTANQAVNIFNNTVYISGAQNATGATTNVHSVAVYRDGSIIANLTIKNNIFVNTRTTNQTTDWHAAMFTSSAISNFTTSDNNILIAPVCVRINTGSVNYATLADWRTATTNTKDMNSSNVDPGFVNANAETPDLNIASLSSSASQTGVYIPEVTNDYKGNLRVNNNGKYDMGAYNVTGPTTIIPANQLSQRIYSIKNASIVFENLEGKAAFIYTLTGQLVYNGIIKTNNYALTLDSGLYLVKAENVHAKVFVK